MNLHRARLTMLLAVTALTAIPATWEFSRRVLFNGWDIVGIPLMLLFFILFTWISVAFWTATFGLVMVLFQRRRTRAAMSQQKDGPESTPAPLPPTAILMPIYNEDTCRVFAGLRAMAESVQQTGNSDAFDLFVLSDTTNPDIWAREEAAWARMRAAAEGGCRVFYRRRVKNRERKAGNIRDFCERWGRNYRYMVILDADSLMTGETLVEMVDRMEEGPKIGILQASPTLVNRESLLARVLQFSNAVYGNIIRAGFTLWSGTEGNYWGHNAIIRVQAFMDSCGLPRLPGKPPWGGEILSHDFVEAALMLKAGWEVVVTADIGGSYEECPSNLIDFAKRDERWSQGNLQHLPLTIARGLKPASRFHMGMGAMSYLASPLWALFMILCVVQGIGLTVSPSSAQALAASGYLPISVALLPFGSALFLLLLVKAWAFLAAVWPPSIAHRFGGVAKLAVSVLFETGLSFLLAPILMALHTTFVINTLLRRKVEWEAQCRSESRLRLSQLYHFHSAHTVAGLTVALLMTWRASALLWWMLPILAGLILSAPISLALSSQWMGRRLRAAGIFLISEETTTPPILVRYGTFLSEEMARTAATPHALICLVADPALLHLHIAMLPENARSVMHPAQRKRLQQIALSGGPMHMSSDERLLLMQDAEALLWLHREAWKDWPVDILRSVAVPPGQ